MFKQVEIAEGDTIAKMVERIFDAPLKIDGGWGYTKEDVTKINDTRYPIQQIEHNLAHMRSYIEMNLMQDDLSRYGSINLIEKRREAIEEYEKVTYEVSAMLEADYNCLIEEYKEGYEKAGFDIEAHFQKRKEATLIRVIDFWFLRP